MKLKKDIDLNRTNLKAIAKKRQHLEDKAKKAEVRKRYGKEMKVKETEKSDLRHPQSRAGGQGRYLSICAFGQEQ